MRRIIRLAANEMASTTNFAENNLGKIARRARLGVVRRGDGGSDSRLLLLGQRDIGGRHGVGGHFFLSRPQLALLCEIAVLQNTMDAADRISRPPITSSR